MGGLSLASRFVFRIVALHLTCSSPRFRQRFADSLLSGQSLFVHFQGGSFPLCFSWVSRFSLLHVRIRVPSHCPSPPCSHSSSRFGNILSPLFLHLFLYPPPLFFVFSTLYSLSLAPLSCLSLVPLPHCCSSLCFNPVRMRGTCLRRCVPALEPVLLGAAVPYLSFPDDRSLLERKSGNLPRITPLHSHRTPIPYVNPFSCFRMATPVVLCFWGLCVHRSGA